ncbi:MAG: DUF4157 domain-containing protein, partial [Anaerolineae bacterium]
MSDQTKQQQAKPQTRPALQTQPEPIVQSADHAPGILALQNQAGNTAVSQSLTSVIQRKPSADVGVCPVCGRQGKGTCPGCGQEFVPLQRKEVAGGTAVSDSGLGTVQSAVQAGGGSRLTGSLRSFFSQRFGQDLGQVRIHNDASAHQAASS